MAIGILTAPRKGKHTRTKIIDELDSAKDTFEIAANKKLAEAKTILNKTIEEQKKSGIATAKKIGKAISS